MEWYPLFSKAFSYSTSVELKISILDECLESLLAVDVGNCLIIWSGWLKEVLTHNKLVLVFLLRFVCTIG